MGQYRNIMYFQANPDKKIFFKYPKLREDYKYYCSIHSTESSWCLALK